MWVILAIAGVSSFPFFSTYVVKYIYISLVSTKNFLVTSRLKIK